MDKEAISLEPEIIQLGIENKQLIKVTNRTNEPIENCLFCLFNTNKYEFSPDSFSLQPREHKIITVTLKLKILDGPLKEFAYLKSKNLNKRLTLLNSQTHTSAKEEEKLRSPELGHEELYTLTSREYKDTQKIAYDKVVAEKEAYIERLERRLEENETSEEKKSRDAFSGGKDKFYLEEISALELKVGVLAKENERLALENLELHDRFSEYRILAERGIHADELEVKVEEYIKEIKCQQEDIKYLEHQCEGYLEKIMEGEVKLQDKEIHYTQKIDHIVQQMESKLEQQRYILEQSLNSKEKAFNDQIDILKMELGNKEKEIESFINKVKKMTKLEQQQEESKNVIMKIELEKSNVEEKNKELKEKLKEYESTINELKEKAILYKSQANEQDSSSSKLNQYLEIALESCKNENEILKKSKMEIENNLNEEMNKSRLMESRANDYERNLKKAEKRMNELEEEKETVEKNKNKEEEENHDKIMKLKSENIDLIEKNSSYKKQLLEKEEETEECKLKIKDYQQKLDKIKENEKKLQTKLVEAEELKEKMSRKVEKYRKEAKRELKNINEDVKEDLKRIEDEKNTLTRKIDELEENELDSRLKTRTHYEINDGKDTRPNVSLSHQGDKKFGIRNQKKSVEESEVNSGIEVDMDKIYGELGQLREFQNYVNKSIKKLRELLNLREGQQHNENKGQNSIFDVISFFKELELKTGCKSKAECELQETQKEMQYLKGRITELEPIAKKMREKDKAEESTIELNRSEVDRNIVEYLREEMKNQYKKQYDALKLQEEKFDLLKRKIYQEYRSRIIHLISKKDRDEYSVPKIEAVLERFVEGLGNTSHKEAILAKEVKLKQEARKEVSSLKSKLVKINKQYEEDTRKKGTLCIREPETHFEEHQFIENVRLEAKMLTYQAENQRISAEISLYQTRTVEAEEQLKLCEDDLDRKEQEIERLKLEVISLAKETNMIGEKYEEEINGYKKKFGTIQKLEKQVAEFSSKEKESSNLRQELIEKTETIKAMREREKEFKLLLDETKRNESIIKQKEKKEYLDETRMEESIRDLRDNNKELRNENSKLREHIDSLNEDLSKKNANLKRLKSEGEEFRIKVVKNDQETIEKIKSENRELKNEVKKLKEDLNKLKKKKERELTERESEMDRSRNEHTIERSSLESVVRALIDTLSGVYCSLDILARRKGSFANEGPDFSELMKNPLEIKSSKIRQAFDEIIESLKG